MGSPQVRMVVAGEIRREIMRFLASIMALIAAAAVVCGADSYAGELKAIELPSPQTESGMPLMKALKERRSSREFSAKELPLQMLSDLLWAANGINRPERGLRTAPTARNMQEIDVYVSMREGLYLYDAAKNALLAVLAQDIRALTGGQPFVKDAPVNLIFVADHSKMAGMPKETVDFYAATDTGFISQNVYLFCASAGLATVVRGWLEKETLEKAMGLGGDKKVILAQSVGYPKQ